MDEVEIHAKAGNGGSGAVSFYCNSKGPCGGKGGKGGDVVICSNSSLNNLEYFVRTRRFEAENGAAGGSNNITGKNGANKVIEVPEYTEVTVQGTKYYMFPNTKFTVLLGGKGGLGNSYFKTSCTQAPRISQPGKPGEESTIKLELKLIADIGFIGAPNAGKSSLMTQLTNAKSKVGNYAFTTLRPYQGMLNHVCLLDLPGIIKDASIGKGLGLRFLKHAQHCKELIMVVDVLDQPLTCIAMLDNEIEQYGQLQKPKYLILNKVDQVNDSTLQNLIGQLSTRFIKIFCTSCTTGTGIVELREALASMVHVITQQQDDSMQDTEQEHNNISEDTIDNN